MRIRLLSAACYCVLTASLCQAIEQRNTEISFEHGTFLVKDFSVSGNES
jgi:hypothetical protein